MDIFGKHTKIQSFVLRGCTLLIKKKYTFFFTCGLNEKYQHVFLYRYSIAVGLSKGGTEIQDFQPVRTLTNPLTFKVSGIDLFGVKQVNYKLNWSY